MVLGEKVVPNVYGKIEMKEEGKARRPPSLPPVVGWLQASQRSLPISRVVSAYSSASLLNDVLNVEPCRSDEGMRRQVARLL